MSAQADLGGGGARILLVDDEPHILSALQRVLRARLAAERPLIDTCSDPFEALQRICACDFDVVICDYMMPRMSGGELLQALKDVAPDTVRIMLSASAEFDTVLSAINQAQAFRFLRKPWEPDELADTVRQALAARAGLLAARRGAAAASVPAPAPTPQELEARRLEADEPGLLDVRRDANGSVIL